MRALFQAPACPLTRSARRREKGDASKARDYLPADKQYLLTRGVPCLRRASTLAYTDADEDAERLLSFADPKDGAGAGGGKEEEWVETHAGRAPGGDAGGAHVGTIDDIPDVDDADADAAAAMGGLSLGGARGEPAEIPDMDEIPDMEEDLEEGEDEATAAPKATAAPSGGVIDSR